MYTFDPLLRGLLHLTVPHLFGSKGNTSNNDVAKDYQPLDKESGSQHWHYLAFALPQDQF